MIASKKVNRGSAARRSRRGLKVHRRTGAWIACVAAVAVGALAIWTAIERPGGGETEQNARAKTQIAEAKPIPGAETSVNAAETNSPAAH